MIKIVIFDADGVLINGKYFRFYLEKDFEIPQEKTKEFFDGVFMDCVIGKKDLRHELPPFLKEWGWTKSLDEFIDSWHKYEHSVDEKLIDYIRALRKKGIICCLATNQDKYRFSYLLKEMGFSECFDKVYSSSYLGYRKPNREFYEKVINDLKVKDKNEVLFWDNDEDNVLGAREFGIKAEVYVSFEDFKNKMQHYL